jgi:anthranilate synthase component 1
VLERELTPARFDTLRGDWDVIPVVRELSADTITPVAAFAAIDDSADEAFLLESVERGETLGRYSFIGFSPRKTISFPSEVDDPVQLLRDELVPLRAYGEDELPPFFGGAVGYFGYGVAGWTERLPDRHASNGIPDAKLLFIDNVIAFDHLRQKLWVIANVFTDDARSAEAILADATERLEATVARLRSATADLTETTDPVEPLEETPSCSREEFIDMVRRAKDDIEAGEIFQIVLSQSWAIRYPTTEALSLYRSLRAVNPSPYMYLLRTRECTLVGASPEMLVRVERGRTRTRPIAGTRPRGRDREADEALERDLLADPKERAEHLMLVDLGRNDLGRVCSSGSGRVEGYARVERYSHVMHIVSDVTGMLRDDRTPIDAFLSCFPAGTVSGAPKIRAMELIDGLEPGRRNAYAGAIAYVGFSGSLDSCIAIRTICLRNDVAIVQAGAGIVFDSVPENEFEETVNKAAALKRAIAIAAGRVGTATGKEA